MAQPANQRGMEADMAAAVQETMAEAMPESRERHPEVTMDSKLDSDLGLDSLTRAELLVTVERKFGVQLPEQLLSEADTPRDILEAVMRLKGEKPETKSETGGKKGEETEAGLDTG